MRYLCWDCTYNNPLCIGKYHLQMDKCNVFFSNIFAKLMIMDNGTLRAPFDDGGKLSVSEYESTENVELQLLVLSDIVFN